MKKVKIQRVKRHKKQLTTQEKILAGIGVGSALVGGIGGAVSPQPQKSRIVSTQSKTEAKARSKVSEVLKSIFGIKEAKASGSGIFLISGGAGGYLGTYGQFVGLLISNGNAVGVVDNTGNNPIFNSNTGSNLTVNDINQSDPTWINYVLTCVNTGNVENPTPAAAVVTLSIPTYLTSGTFEMDPGSDTATETVNVTNSDPSGSTAFTVTTSNSSVAHASVNGSQFSIIAGSTSGGTATITFKSTADPSKTATISVHIKAAPAVRPVISAIQGYDQSKATTDPAAYTNGTAKAGQYLVLYGTFSANSDNTVTIDGNSANVTGQLANQINVLLSGSIASGSHTVTVTNPGGTSIAGSFTVPSAAVTPVITTTSLAHGNQNTAYSQTMTATNLTSDYLWTLSNDGLPPGLDLDLASGVISGTPTTPGTYSFKIGLDNANVFLSKLMTIVIDAPAVTPTITTTSLSPSTATVGTLYTGSALTQNGFGSGLNWSSGNLPAGFSINSATGVISGTPATAGTPTFTVTASDSAGHSDSKIFGLTVSPAGVTVSLNFTGVSFDKTTAAIGGNYNATFAGSSTGVSSTLVWFDVLVVGPGSTTASWVNNWQQGATGNHFLDAATDPVGVYTIGAIRAHVDPTDHLGASVAASATITVTSVAVVPVSITTNALANGVVGTAYSPVTLTATGLGSGVTWSATGLPAALTLSSAGVLSGTPTAATTVPASVNITVRDSAGATVSKTFSLTVTTATVTAPTLTSATVSGNILTLTGTGFGTGTSGNFVSITNSAGVQLTLNILSATATATQITTDLTGQPPGSYTVKVANGANPTSFSGSQTFTIGFPAPTIASATVSGNNLTLVGTGFSDITIVNVVHVIGSTGDVVIPVTTATTTQLVADISGLPAGNYTVKMANDLHDFFAFSNTKSFTISAPASITTDSLPAGTVGTNYSQVLAATGFTSVPVWTVTAGALPAGLALDSASGVISGTPTLANNSNLVTPVFTVQAKAGTLVATKQFGIQVNPVGVIVPTLSSATVSGNNLTLAGTGFDAAAANNTVKITDSAGHVTTATVTVATATQLTVSIGGLIPGNYTVTVAPASDPTKVSNFKSFTIAAAVTAPTLLSATVAGNNLILAGNGFDTTLANNTVTITDSAGHTTTATVIAVAPAGIISAQMSVSIAGLTPGTYSVTAAPTSDPTRVSNSLTFTIAAAASTVLGLSASSVNINLGSATQTATVTATVTTSAGINHLVSITPSDPNHIMTGIVDTSTGVITITAVPGTAGGTATLTVHPQALAVTDTSQDKIITVVVTPANTTSGPSFTTTGLPAALAAQPYAGLIQASDSDPAATAVFTFSLAPGSTLPGNFVISSGGIISGTAPAAGSYSFSIKVTDSLGKTATQSFTLTVTAGTGGGGSTTDINQTIANLNATISALQQQIANGGNNSNVGGLLLQNQLLQQQLNQLNRSGVQTFSNVPAGGLLQMPAGYPAPSGGAVAGAKTTAGAVAGAEISGTLGTYKVKRGDTLWAISKKYYGDGRKWRVILEANTDKVKSPRTLQIGTVLTIPKI